MSSHAAGPPPTTLIEKVIKRDRVLVIAGLAGVTLLAWVYTVYEARRMDGMDMLLCIPRLQGWDFTEFLLLFLMWTIMMAAMMIPSVSSKVLMYAATIRRMGSGSVMKMTGIFVVGYLASWSGYSLLASFAQLELHEAALMSPEMGTTNPYLGGGIMISAGIFQWTPLKNACLTRCRSSLSFLITEWREGMWGAFIIGVKDGLFCVGCCWLLMAIMFVVGVMNLIWIAALTIFVLVEKIIPAGEIVAKLAGVFLIGYGLWIITDSLAL